MRPAVLLFFLIAEFHTAIAQIYLSSGANFHVSEGCNFYVSGNVDIDSFSVFQNNGSVLCDSAWLSYGTTTNNGLIQTRGDVFLFGTTTNALASVWCLNGENQQVSATLPLIFGALEFLGAGTKQLNNSITSSRLKLENCKVNTMANALQLNGVSNNDLEANNAWIYSSLGGLFLRNMQSLQVYDFPVGSDLAFRPLRLSSQSPGNCGVRFSENGAGNEGVSMALMDAAICSVGNEFNYRISTSGVDSLSIQGAYESDWLEGKIIWAAAQLFPQTAWTPLATQRLATADSMSFSCALSGPGEWVLSHYSVRPNQPQILGNDTLCAGPQSALYSINPMEDLTYLWTVSAAGNSASYEGASLSLNWNGEPGAGISVFATNDAGCSSLPASMNIHFIPLPIANFETELPVFPSTEEPIQFNNLSNGASSYTWEFGDGELAFDFNVAHTFLIPGVYAVSLYVQNEFGCSDSVTRNIEILEDIVFPNVFSPNGDGLNDVLEIYVSGIKVLSLSIFDRWGNLIFESDQPKLFWDGRNTNGNRMPTGTYFAVLKAEGQTKYFDKRQCISLFE